MKILDLLEAEREDGKFRPDTNSPNPVHRKITTNKDDEIYMQIYHKSHEQNYTPPSKGWLNSPDNKVDFPERWHAENGRVVLIGKKNGWKGDQRRIAIHFEDIDEVIEALRFAKQKLEADEQ